MKYIKTYEGISNRLNITVKQVKENVEEIKQFQNKIIQLCKYENVVADQTNQMQTMPNTRPEDERYVGYIHTGKMKGGEQNPYFWADKTIVEVIYKFSDDEIKIKYFNETLEDPLNEFIDNAIRKNSYDVVENQIYNNKSFEYFIAFVNKTKNLIDDLSIEKYNIFKDSKKYNI